ncbi:NACHT, LRR and PYD domains-containing protein 1b allele 2-like [Scomber japonicus]|uniref:NACHT, LRR and PYD domains-containing protein 1b allele 2-like n=1 Tax=Scomber japonicus TaxID=13676 RepID=UPI0023057CF0|nr:NACHT, LRR and PYD domains-containing protein 1b allele 2-like [Scomber japonicus]
MIRGSLSRISRDHSHKTSESRSFHSDLRNQDAEDYRPLKRLKERPLECTIDGDSTCFRSLFRSRPTVLQHAVYTDVDDIDDIALPTGYQQARKPIAMGQLLPSHRTARRISSITDSGSSSYSSLPIPSAVPGRRHPQSRPTVFQDSTVCTEAGRVHDAFNLLSVSSESQSGGDSEALVDMETPLTVEHYSVTKTLPTHSHLQTYSLDPGLRRRHSSSLPHSHSVPAFNQIPSEKNKSFTRAESVPDMLLKDSFEEFIPDITVDENEKTYRFHCSHQFLYRCTLTGLVFHMEGEGDMVYRIVPWNHRLLAQYHKKPAGPLFDIKCLQESVCQLHLPHCEIRSTGGCKFLSVAHVIEEGIEFITPHKITETHVIINITEFSGFGMVKDEDSPPDPVEARVLLFYRPPTDPDPESVLNVLLLPKNIVLHDVQQMRKKLVGDERYVEISPHCKLIPKQEYTLSTSPEDDSVLVQPTEAEFDAESYDNYFPSFQVNLETIMRYMKLFLRETNSSHSVWERHVRLLSTGVRKPCGQSALSSPSTERLKYIWTGFIDGISEPVLESLLDKLFEKKVITDPERESAEKMKNRRDKARFVIDTVTKKGEAASSEMIEFLCEVDPFLCEHLGLI